MTFLVVLTPCYITAVLMVIARKTRCSHLVPNFYDYQFDEILDTGTVKLEFHSDAHRSLMKKIDSLYSFGLFFSTYFMVGCFNRYLTTLLFILSFYLRLISVTEKTSEIHRTTNKKFLNSVIIIYK
jgi:hypothetical protein